VLIADNNPFNSREMHKFAEEWNFAIITSSPNYAQSIGQAERGVQTVNGLFRKAFESGTLLIHMLLYCSIEMHQ